jgi:hypothetical protein
MSGLLSLARDYIERMANPVYGLAMNEEYSLRFAQLLETEGFESSLRREIEALHDADELTSNGWLWLFGWAKTRQIELEQELLLDLFNEWSSIVARCAIVDVAIHQYRPEVRMSRDLPLGEFPHPMLARMLRDATEVTEAREERIDRPSSQLVYRRPTIRAEDLLMVLLQVDDPITIAAASTLLRHRWEGHEQLNTYLRELATTWDNETRGVWSDALGVRLSPER